MKIIPLPNLPLIQEGNDLATIIVKKAREEKIHFQENDILCVTQKIVSKAEGNIIDLTQVKPSTRAFELAERTGKDPRVVEVILREAKEIVRVGEHSIICETRHGFVCANAGVDQSNVEKEHVTLLPKNPDRSAELIRKKIRKLAGSDVGVIVLDTQGRAFRNGVVGLAVGVAGVTALWDRRGERDLFGNELKVTQVAVADELAAAASVVMGEAAEKIPVVVIRDVQVPFGDGCARDLIMPRERDLFR